MRILVVSDLPQFVTGGAERQAEQLIHAWLEAGHQVTCFGRRMRGTEASIGQHRIQVRRIRTIQRCGRLLRGASYFCSLAWILFRSRHSFDLIYTRFLGEAAFTAALLKAIGILRIALVATPAGAGTGLDISLFDGLPFRDSVLRLLDRQCDAINLIAPSMSQQLKSSGFSGSNFACIPNGVVLRPIPTRRRPELNRLMAVGRASPEKGYDILLEAIARNREMFGPGGLTLIGDGPELPRLKQMTRELEIEHIVEFMGNLPHDRVTEELDRACAFVVPSRSEGMSNAGLEALERCIPIVITRCGGLDSYIDPEVGWVVPPGCVEALSAAIRQVLCAAPGSLEQMGKRARELVAREFDMDAVSKRYLSLFERLTKSA